MVFDILTAFLAQPTDELAIELQKAVCAKLHRECGWDRKRVLRRFGEDPVLKIVDDYWQKRHEEGDPKARH